MRILRGKILSGYLEMLKETKSKGREALFQENKDSGRGTRGEDGNLGRVFAITV